MDLEQYKTLIDRIVSERGVQAIPKLLELLTDESEEVREIALQTIQRFGDQAKPILMSKFKQKMHEQTKNDVLTLYLVDILSDFQEKGIKNDLYKLLSRYDQESAQLVIYEALAKLGEGEKIIDILSYFLLEDEYRNELAEQVIMALAHIHNHKAIDILVKAYYDEQLHPQAKPFIVEAISMITMNDQQLWEYLQQIAGEKLLKDLKEYLKS
ncbi:MAG TPA: HEAT repeat domain-containing protein [Pseudothermotoga sp.]|nr:HEAT repeat domain-containing protein [Pseudothermotoga sp.]HOK84393.1 HEAT repeat domain-containing protein [Pseudothermotoga sp.]HPP70579.1 HEAT repeat domain-containing protein [Pseudothermotoga sp.]